jgi:hypothetical protein
MARGSLPRVRRELGQLRFALEQLHRQVVLIPSRVAACAAWVREATPSLA